MGGGAAKPKVRPRLCLRLPRAPRTSNPPLINNPVLPRTNMLTCTKYRCYKAGAHFASARWNRWSSEVQRQHSSSRWQAGGRRVKGEQNQCGCFRARGFDSASMWAQAEEKRVQLQHFTCIFLCSFNQSIVALQCNTSAGPASNLDDPQVTTGSWHTQQNKILIMKQTKKNKHSRCSVPIKNWPIRSTRQINNLYLPKQKRCAESTQQSPDILLTVFCLLLDLKSLGFAVLTRTRWSQNLEGQFLSHSNKNTLKVSQHSARLRQLEMDFQPFKYLCELQKFWKKQN